MTTRRLDDGTLVNDTNPNDPRVPTDQHNPADARVTASNPSGARRVDARTPTVNDLDQVATPAGPSLNEHPLSASPIPDTMPTTADPRDPNARRSYQRRCTVDDLAGIAQEAWDYNRGDPRDVRERFRAVVVAVLYRCRGYVSRGSRDVGYGATGRDGGLDRSADRGTADGRDGIDARDRTTGNEAITGRSGVTRDGIIDSGVVGQRSGLTGLTGVDGRDDMTGLLGDLLGPVDDLSLGELTLAEQRRRRGMERERKTLELLLANGPEAQLRRLDREIGRTGTDSPDSADRALGRTGDGWTDDGTDRPVMTDRSVDSGRNRDLNPSTFAPSTRDSVPGEPWRP